MSAQNSNSGDPKDWDPDDFDPNTSPFFQAWGRFVLRWRWPLFLGLLGITGFLIYTAVTKLVIDTSMEAYLSDDSHAMRILKQTRADFGNDLYFQIVAEGDVFSMPYLKRLKALHQELAKLDVPLTGSAADRGEPQPDENEQADQLSGFGNTSWGNEKGGTIVQEIISLVNARQVRFTGGALSVEGLLDHWPAPDQLAALKKRVLRDPTLVGQLIGPGGRDSVIVLRTAKMSEKNSARVSEAIHHIAARFQAPGFHVYVAGVPALGAELDKYILSDLERVLTIAVLAMLFIMFLIFRHPIGVVGPISVVTQSAIWAAGAMALTGVHMTMITNVLPVLLITVGMGDSIHIQSVYREHLKRGFKGEDAIVSAMGITGMPVLFTSLTTAVGLFSFRLANMQAIRDVGTFGTLGVMVAWLLSMVFLPIMLSFHHKGLLGMREHGRDILDRALELCERAWRDHRKGTLAVSFAVAAFAAVSLPSLRFGHDPAAWVPPQFDLSKALNTLNDKVGGASSVILTFDSRKPGGIENRDLLVRMAKLEHYIDEYRRGPDGKRMVDNTTSVLDVLRESWRAVHDGDKKYYTIPDTQQGVNDMFTLFESAGQDELRRFATIDLQKTIMFVRVQWLDALEYRPLTEHIEKGVARFIGNAAHVDVTGSVFNMFAIARSVLFNLLLSLGASIVVISILMIVLLRDVKLGLLSMIPNLIPIAVVLAFMAILKIKVDASNLLVCPISLGIAVDDTIHLYHHFKTHYRAHGDVEAAIAHAYHNTGRAMIITSLIGIVGFGVFLFASLYNLETFGGLCALAVLLALLADLMVSPALVRLAFKDRPGVHAPATEDVQARQAS